GPVRNWLGFVGILSRPSDYIANIACQRNVVFCTGDAHRHRIGLVFLLVRDPPERRFRSARARLSRTVTTTEAAHTRFNFWGCSLLASTPTTYGETSFGYGSACAT